MRIYEAALPDFELFDSAHPVPSEDEYQKTRAELWFAFCQAVRAQTSPEARVKVALNVLEGVFDDPRLPADVLLEVLFGAAHPGPGGPVAIQRREYEKLVSIRSNYNHAEGRSNH